MDPRWVASRVMMLPVVTLTDLVDTAAEVGVNEMAVVVVADAVVVDDAVAD